ncbi:MAG: hypothetical protein HY220_04220 [Candidatus Sungbacteria bacterium]|uniref:TrpR like protein, YerC/YecD n=1 Tax=Candidatus Sungiibacteriota bacterium TaxID=2750080 RepID=A0A9D6LP56_9BACT|nr:hypothetical protein [Candidatus Sungbacteria bacterium]
MPHLSRYKLTPGHIDDLSSRIVEATLILRDRGSLKLFFDDLLTTTEKAMLGKRILIALLLEEDYSYQQIERILKVSQTTIGTISEKLQRDGRGFRMFIKNLERSKNFKNTFETIEKLFMSLPRKSDPRGRWNMVKV